MGSNEMAKQSLEHLDELTSQRSHVELARRLEHRLDQPCELLDRLQATGEILAKLLLVLAQAINLLADIEMRRTGLHVFVVKTHVELKLTPAVAESVLSLACVKEQLHRSRLIPCQFASESRHKLLSALRCSAFDAHLTLRELPQQWVQRVGALTVDIAVELLDHARQGNAVLAVHDSSHD